MKICDWIEVLKSMNPNVDVSIIRTVPMQNGVAVVYDQPDPIQVIRDLFDAGNLEDHHYAIRESEGLGWDGPRMVKWGQACADARKLMRM